MFNKQIVIQVSKCNLLTNLRDYHFIKAKKIFKRFNITSHFSYKSQLTNRETKLKNKKNKIYFYFKLNSTFAKSKIEKLNAYCGPSELFKGIFHKM